MTTMIAILIVYALIVTVMAWGVRSSQIYWRNQTKALRQIALENAEPDWHHYSDEPAPAEEMWKMFLGQFAHAPTLDDKIRLISYWADIVDFTLFEENWIVTSFESEAERHQIREVLAAAARKKLDSNGEEVGRE